MKTKRRSHRTNSEVQRTISDIRKLRNENKSDAEIRDILDISLRLYQKYMKRIHELDKAAWLSITSKELESELLRLMDSLNDTYRRALALANTKDYSDVLEALATKDNARMNIVKLLVEGSQYIEKVKEKLETETVTNNIITANHRTSYHTR